MFNVTCRSQKSAERNIKVRWFAVRLLSRDMRELIFAVNFCMCSTRMIDSHRTCRRSTMSSMAVDGVVSNTLKRG